LDPRDDVSEPESEHNRMTRLGGRRGRFIARQLDYGLSHKSQIGVGHLPVHFSLHFDLLHFCICRRHWADRGRTRNDGRYDEGCGGQRENEPH